MRRLVLLVVCLLVALSVLPSLRNPLSVFATNRTWYVGEDATNVAPCSSGAPCDLATVISTGHAAPGDTIDFEAGTYDDVNSNTITGLNGMSGNPITITADQGVLFAYAPGDCSGGTSGAPGPLLTIINSNYLTVTGLIFDGQSGAAAFQNASLQCTLPSTSAAVAIAGSSSFLILDSLTIKHVLGTCLWNGSSSSTAITVQHSTIADCTTDGQYENYADGIHLVSGGSDTVTTTTVTRVSGDGIFLDSTAQSPGSITGNTVYNAGYAGLRTNDSNVTFDHNTIWDSGQAGIKASQFDTITYNDIVSTSVSSQNPDAGSGNSESGIRFVTTGSGEVITHNDLYYGSDSMANPAVTPNPTTLQGATSVAIRQDTTAIPSAGNTIMCNILVGIPDQSGGTPPTVLPYYVEEAIDPNLLAPIPSQTIIANDYIQNIEPTSTVETISTPVDPRFVQEPVNMSLDSTSLLKNACPDGTDIGSGH